MQYPTISEYVKANQDASDNLDMSTKATNAELKEAIEDEWGVKYSKDGRKLLRAPYVLNGFYSIKKGARIICDEAFWALWSLYRIVIPDSVTSIGDRAFARCKSLHRIVIPDSVTSIGDGAFAGCHSLTDIVIPDSVTSIGDGAFHECYSLSSLVIPNSVVNLKGNPFADWNGELKCLSPYFIYDNKVLFDKDKNAIFSFRDKDATSYVIPDSVTSIGSGAFYGCRSLSSIVIPSSVTSIGEHAFDGCNFSYDFKQKLSSRFGTGIFEATF